MPFVSVVLPTFNRALTLERAVRSVLIQTFPDFELVIVDDGSNDGTREILQSFSDPRLRLIRHEHNQGAAASRNRGIRESRGELVAFQDSDDEWVKDKLALQIDLLEESSSEVGVVFAQFSRMKDESHTVFPRGSSRLPPDLHDILLYRNLVSTQTALVKRKCFDKAGLFDIGLPSLLDWDLWLRISKFFHFACVNKPLAKVYFTPGGISSDRMQIASAIEAIVSRYQADFDSNPDALAWQYHCIGNIFCLGGTFHRGRQYLWQAVRLRPQSMHYRVSALVSILGESFYRSQENLRQIIRPDWY